MRLRKYTIFDHKYSLLKIGMQPIKVKVSKCNCNYVRTEGD